MSLTKAGSTRPRSSTGLRQKSRKLQRHADGERGAKGEQEPNRLFVGLPHPDSEATGFADQPSDLGDLPSNPGNQPSDSDSGDQPSDLGDLPSNLGNQPSDLGDLSSDLGDLPSNPGNQPSDLGDLSSDQSTGNQPSDLGDLPSNSAFEQLTRTVNMLVNQNWALHRRIDEFERDTKKEAPTAKLLDDRNVLIGNGDAAHILSKSSYLDAFHRSKKAKIFVLRLLGEVYTPHELARSNFYGGSVKYNGTRVLKEPLFTKLAFRAILVQAAIDFPGCFPSEKSQTDLRNAINAKCRRALFGLKK